MRNGVFKAAVFFLALGALDIRVRGDEGFSWGGVEKQIWSEMAADKDFAANREMLWRLPTVATYAAKKDLGLFNEMTAQKDENMVALCGYLLIEKLYPESAFRAACRVLLGTDQPRFAFNGIMIEQLGKAKAGGVDFREQFSEILRIAPRERVNVAMIASAVPVGFLEDWWNHGSRDVLISNETVVVDALMGEKKVLAEGTRASLRARIQEYRDIPGDPRMTYLYWGDPPAEDVEKLLRAVLVDEAISDIDAEAEAVKYQEVVRRVGVPGFGMRAGREKLVKGVLKIP